MRCAILLAAIVLTPLPALAGARCNAPPYGGSVASYKAFIKDLGPLLDDPSRMLMGICNVKFSGADRKATYNLGFTDQDINSKDVSDLAVDMITALKSLVDHTH